MPKNGTKGVIFIKELLLKRKSRFFLYILACFIPVIDRLLLNSALALLIGSIEVGDMNYFKRIVIFSFAVIVLGSILYIISRFMRISFMRDTLLDVRLKAFEKIIGLTYKDFNMKSKDSYVSNLINDVNTFENIFFLKLINFIYNGGVYVVSLIILTYLDYKFAFSVFLISFILFFITKSFEKKTISLQNDVSDYNEDFSINISNTFNGLEILKLNNIEDKFLTNTLLRVKKLERKKFDYTVFTDGQQRFTGFLGFLIVIGILLYLASQLAKGASFTYITFMFQLSNSCIWSITQILPLLNELKSSTQIYNKITKTIDKDENDLERNEKFQFESNIEVRDLSFSYEGKDVFKGVSFTIEPGKKYLVKGASGAGKSTLIKVLSMVYDDYDGEILVDGVDYRNIELDSFNNQVSFIYQDVFLFEDTILNNICLYNKYDENSIIKAVKMAGLEPLLEQKENGINEMILENGKNLSGGERQRISIARAIVKDSSILFVDEGTSSLDPELGRKVEETILSLENTVIAISHRYYEGITEKYDYVLEITNGIINKYSSSEYFQEVLAI